MASMMARGSCQVRKRGERARDGERDGWAQGWCGVIEVCGVADRWALVSWVGGSARREAAMAAAAVAVAVAVAHPSS